MGNLDLLFNKFDCSKAIAATPKESRDVCENHCLGDLVLYERQ